MSTTATTSTKNIFALHNELLLSTSEYLPNESLRWCNSTSRPLHPFTCDTLRRRNATLPELNYGKVTRTPFHKAAKSGDVAQLKSYLPKLGCHKNSIINRRDHGGFTPLHSAAIAGHAEVIWNLLRHGADPSILDQAGNTALHIATEFKHYATMVVLLGNGADVNTAATSGFTPLHLATYNGDLESVEILLEAGADADALCLGLKPAQVGEIMAESRAEKNVVCAKLFATNDRRCRNKCTRKMQYQLREAKGGMGLAELKFEGEDVVDFFWE